MHTRVLPDLVEAASRSGDRETAEGALRLLPARATACEAPFGLALLARSEALMAADGDAERRTPRRSSSPAPADALADLARSHLVYGEWLRRQRRPSDAREQLRTAHTMFTRWARPASPSGHDGSWRRPGSGPARAPSTPLAT